MSCIICGENSVIEMLGEMNVAFLIIGRDHHVKKTGRIFRSLARNPGFEIDISLYSDEIGIFDENEFKALNESVFISESSVKPVTIDILDGEGVKRHLKAGFYPLSSCDNCSRSVLIIINDETQNFGVYDRINELNRKLHTINEIISISTSTTKPFEIIKTAVKKTVELLNFDAGAFYCLDEDHNTAQISAYYGLYELYFPSVVKAEDTLYPFNKVYGKKMPVYSEQYLGTPHDENELGVFSMGCVPVMADNAVIGSLNVATSSFHKFTISEKETIEALGRQIGGVIRLANLQQSLIKSNENANLYLDIILHDINNANMVSAGYLSLIEECCLKEFVYAKKALCGVEQSINIIKNVSVIRALRENNSNLSHVPLDYVIKLEISHFHDVNIRYNECGISVTADELLSEVFVNLFGNSVRFGGDNVCIDISVVEKGDFVEVSVSDDGPGISDEIKPVVFDRFYKGKLKPDGKGLGLSIVRMILERYGSTVSVGDRVKGSYDCGAKFTFLLKKA